MRATVERAMTLSLFTDAEASQQWREELCSGAVVLRGFARSAGAALVAMLRDIAIQAPFRHMVTPGGFRMSVAMTNCGRYGWVSDDSGYRYDALDPASGRPWPPMPEAFCNWLKTRRRPPALSSLSQRSVSSTVTNQARDCRCIKTRTNATLARPSSRSRWVCRRYSCSVGCAEMTRPRACRWRTRTWWCGADPQGCAITASCRSKQVITR